MAEQWKPDPAKGGAHIEARKTEVILHLCKAADVAFYHIEDQLAHDIEAAHKKAAQTKARLVQAVQKAESLPALTVVRKYWQKTDDDILHHLTETILRD